MRTLGQRLVVRARVAPKVVDLDGWDRIEFDDFVVKSVFLVRREEWLSDATNDERLIGRSAREQNIGSVGDADAKSESVEVDAGVAFISTYGAHLSLIADVFPLVFQLRYEVLNSALSPGTKIPVGEVKTLQ